jgi:protein DGCR14
MTQPDSGERSTKPERSLNEQIILEEDEYTAALSHIIARDFFPSLVHLDATNGYLDAVRSRDPSLIAASVRRLEEVSDTPVSGPSRRGRPVNQTPGRTPYASFPSDTPYVHNADEEEDEPTAKRPRYDTTLSLDEFQARYTSEDNSSFTQILDEENKKRGERYDWAWDAQARVEAQRGRMLEARERSMIEPPDGSIPGVKEKFRIEAQKPAGLITGPEHNLQEERRDEEKAVVKATSVEEATQAVMAPRKDNRTAGVDGWNFKVEVFYLVNRFGCNRADILDRPETLSCFHQTQIFHPTIRRLNQSLKRTKKGNQGSFHMETHD